MNASLSDRTPDAGEELWGPEAERISVESEQIGPIPPVTLLLSLLYDTEPELAEFMKTFDFIPIGEDQNYEEC